MGKQRELAGRYGNPRAGRGEMTLGMDGDLAEYQGLTESQRYNDRDNIDPSKPRIIQGGLGTYEIPITQFPGDFVIPVNAAGSQVSVALPPNCVGMRVISLTPNVTASINGGGSRTLKDGDVFSNCQLDSVLIATDATGTCIIQTVGL